MKNMQVVGCGYRLNNAGYSLSYIAYQKPLMIIWVAVRVFVLFWCGSHSTVLREIHFGGLIIRISSIISDFFGGLLRSN
jgi:hypothetical protein